MNVEDDLAQRFVCCKCHSRGGRARRVGLSGAGLTGLLDLPHSRYIAVSCAQCGYTELYNPEVLERDREGADAREPLPETE